MSIVSSSWAATEQTDFLKTYNSNGKRDPSYFVYRYEHELKYKEWFDKNWGSKYKSIYEAVGLPEPVKTTAKTETTKTTKNIESKIPSTNLEIQNYLPNRNDIGTEWNIKGIRSTSMDDTAFRVGLCQSYDPYNAASSGTLSVCIYSFDSETNLSKVFQEQKDRLIKEGGFKTIDTSSIKADDCLGMLFPAEGSFVEPESEIMCQKNNVYFILNAYHIPTFQKPWFNSASDLLKFAKTVADKIPDSASNQIVNPELTIEDSISSKQKTTKNIASKIPSWIKDKALLFGQGKISEDEYLRSVQFLVDNGIVKSNPTNTAKDNSITNTQQPTKNTPTSTKSAPTKPITNSQILTNSDFTPVFTQPAKYKDKWSKLYGKISQEPMIYDNYTILVFDLSQGGEFSFNKRVWFVSQNAGLNLKEGDCLLAEGKIIGSTEASILLTGRSITVPVVNLAKFSPISCIEAEYPTETSITVNQSQTLGSLTITVNKIELTKYHVRTYLKIENSGNDDVYFRDSSGKIIQNKKQYTTQYVFGTDYDDIESSIPAGVIEEGIVVFKPLPDKSPFQLIFDSPESYWNGQEWITQKFVFNISP